MPEEVNEGNRRRGTIVSAVIVLLALASLGGAIYKVTLYPRTDDAEVFANFIGIAPQVEGPITHLNVRDNQFVHAGDLLFTIDDRPYLYALQRAQSEQAALEGQIVDERRRISAQQTSVAAAQASAENQAAEVLRSQAVIRQEVADVDASRAGVARAQAQLDYATSNLHRLEPLLRKQYVTADQVQQAQTDVRARQQEVDQARAQQVLAEARLAAAARVTTSRRQDSSRARLW